MVGPPPSARKKQHDLLFSSGQFDKYIDVTGISSDNRAQLGEAVRSIAYELTGDFNNNNSIR
jgi:hypothetical protein